MNRYRVTWWEQVDGTVRDRTDLVLAHSAADALVQVETAHKGRLLSSSGDSFHSIREIVPAPLTGWECKCGVTWSALGPACCHSCGALAVPPLKSVEARA